MPNLRPAQTELTSLVYLIVGVNQTSYQSLDSHPVRQILSYCVVVLRVGVQIILFLSLHRQALTISIEYLSLFSAIAAHR